MLVRQLSWILVIFIFIAVGESKMTGLRGGCNGNDLRGLTAFKSGIRHDTSGRLEKWVGRDCCKWEGVTCEKKDKNTVKRVSELRLPGLISGDDFIIVTSMEGTLSPSIISLSALEVLDLSNLVNISGMIPRSIGSSLPNLRQLLLNGNELTGFIPESISNLSKLEDLQLHENHLSGTLPSSLGNLQYLRRLFLHSNKFSGQIPPSLMKSKNLLTLDLHGNNLKGRIPENIGMLKDLRKLDFSDNSLSGTLPSSLKNLTSLFEMYLEFNVLEGELITLPPSLGFLRLDGNRLTGRIPPFFQNLVSLQKVSLANNKFRGSLPSTLGSLSQLYFLNISNNLIEGPLPNEISSLQNLQTLDLSFNPLNLSPIPEWIGELPALCSIFLAGCGIKGELPEFLQSVQSPIFELDLSSNNLTGALPNWLGDLTSLSLLNLSRNFLASNLPNSLAQLKDLGVLDLHSNRLTGPIDHIFTMQKSSLKYVDLSHNKLTGGLPDSFRKMGTLQSLDLSYNRLGSDFPASLGLVSALERLNMQKNKFTGEIPNTVLKLGNLKELNLSDNLLVGEIPKGKPLSRFPKSSYSGNRGLCGIPLAPCRPGV
ncbi:hypothetical protein GIB67_036898 [Kingdonia uniflora]|uniref:Leucine-rich repeat-containing N-terminal plant-type domain-containing protein n=1 Tax=Kingdonia uniflora TaxID=39325 RepID=A0A7J7NW02_9MAGN|nr:hypothetical protein GIB67_036898 [Kingdonia uniflora]